MSAEGNSPITPPLTVFLPHNRFFLLRIYRLGSSQNTKVHWFEQFYRSVV